MNPEDIQRHINEAVMAALKEHLPQAVQTAVDTAVNGKVKALSEKMTPIAEAYDSWLSTKRLAATAVGLFISVGGLIAAAEAFYGFITGHFTLK